MEKRLLKALLSNGDTVRVKYDHLEVHDGHFLVYEGDLFKASFSIETTIIDVTDSELNKSVKKQVLPEVDKSKIEKFTKK